MTPRTDGKYCQIALYDDLLAPIALQSTFAVYELLLLQRDPFCAAEPGCSRTVPATLDVDSGNCFRLNFQRSVSFVGSPRGVIVLSRSSKILKSEKRLTPES